MTAKLNAEGKIGYFFGAFVPADTCVFLLSGEANYMVVLWGHPLETAYFGPNTTAATFKAWCEERGIKRVVVHHFLLTDESQYDYGGCLDDGTAPLDEFIENWSNLE